MLSAGGAVRPMGPVGVEWGCDGPIVRGRRHERLFSPSSRSSVSPAARRRPGPAPRPRPPSGVRRRPLARFRPPRRLRPAPRRPRSPHRRRPRLHRHRRHRRRHGIDWPCSPSTTARHLPGSIAARTGPTGPTPTATGAMPARTPSCAGRASRPRSTARAAVGWWPVGGCRPTTVAPPTTPPTSMSIISCHWRMPSSPVGGDGRPASGAPSPTISAVSSSPRPRRTVPRGRSRRIGGARRTGRHGAPTPMGGSR